MAPRMCHLNHFRIKFIYTSESSSFPCALPSIFHFTVCNLIVLSVIYLSCQVFLEPLKDIQQMGHLQHVDADKIFCNLQDLCEVMKTENTSRTSATLNLQVLETPQAINQMAQS